MLMSGRLNVQERVLSTETLNTNKQEHMQARPKAEQDSANYSENLGLVAGVSFRK